MEEEIEQLKEKNRYLHHQLQSITMANEVLESRLREAVNNNFEIHDYELRTAQVKVLEIFDNLLYFLKTAEETSGDSNFISLGKMSYESMMYFIKREVNNLLKIEYYQDSSSASKG